jgi:hypothetical protein
MCKIPRGSDLNEGDWYIYIYIIYTYYYKTTGGFVCITYVLCHYPVTRCYI